MRILQDYLNYQLRRIFANAFVANMQQIIIRDVEDEIKEEKKDAEYEYKVNKNLSLGFMKDRIIDIITTRNDNKKKRSSKN